MVDVGAGDGRAVRRRAESEPRTLAVGIDANAAGLVDVSRRAARPARKGGRPNALFVVAAAEELPGPLARRADLVTVTMPWGSLLRGVLGADEGVAANLAALLAPNGRLLVHASVTDTDRAGLPPIDRGTTERAARDFARHGLRLDDARLALPRELLATRSSWARRLGDRPVWRFEYRRADPASIPPCPSGSP